MAENVTIDECPNRTSSNSLLGRVADESEGRVQICP